MKLGALAGIHEDVIRLEQALAILRKADCEMLVCLGDIVGYSVPYFGFLKSRDAHVAVQLVRRSCQHVVAGNHDLHAVRRIPSYQNVFAYPLNWYELDIATRRDLSRGRVWLYDEDLPAVLTRADEDYLRALPEFLAITVDGIGIMLSHYAYPDLSGDSVAFDPAVPENLGQHLSFMAAHGCCIGLSGHDGTHGLVMSTATETCAVGFGAHGLPQEHPIWIQGPWVANGTYANGVLVLDTVARSVCAIPLSSPPHMIPDWAER